MLGPYLNSSAVHEVQISLDDRGKPLFAPPQTIACRKILETQEIVTPDRQVVQTSHVYYLNTPVVPGDKLDGRLVQGVVEWTTLTGHVLGYKAVV